MRGKYLFTMPGITPLIPAGTLMTCKYQPSAGCIAGMVSFAGKRAVIDGAQQIRRRPRS
jgi:hypothetical protein